MRSWLPALAVRHPVTVLMTFLATLVLGALAYARIPLQMMPSGFSPPFMWVWVPYEDAVEAPRREHSDLALWDCDLARRGW